MSVSIRPARLEDAAAIAHVHVETWKTAYRGMLPQQYLDSLQEQERAQSWKQWLERPQVSVLVAEQAPGLCGFIGAGPLREPVGSADSEFYAIYVLAQMQQRGIGASLMRAMARVLANQGFRSPAVWVLAQNPARHFYARLGASPAAAKQIQIGGVELEEIAYAWESLDSLLLPGIQEHAR